MLLQKVPSSFVSAGLLAGIATLGLSLLTGCGIGEPATGIADSGGGQALSGVLHGGPNPILGARIDLYFTAGTAGSTGYGVGAVSVANTTTTTPGGNFTLPNPSEACPAGSYAYVTAYGGTTGGYSANSNSLMMVPLGLCSNFYAPTTPYAYSGGTLWIDELTTVASAYALGNFMTVASGCSSGSACAVNIGAPANNTITAAVGSSSVAPQASGLAHAFANALALVNNSTGQPNTYMYPTGSGGVIPAAEINLLGNILQACVNTGGVTGAYSATGNDGYGCEKLFSFTAAPSSVTALGTSVALPTNTLQAMVNLAKFPLPGAAMNTTTTTQTDSATAVAAWDSTCTTSGTASTTTACIAGLGASSGAYTSALTSVPPDWALAIVYTNGYGLNKTATGCTTSPYCPGLTYPFYVALDYQDNVYVLDYDAFVSGTLPQAATNWTNIIGLSNAGVPIFSTAEDTTHKAISIIGTDLAQHVFGAVAVNTNPSPVLVYSATSGAVLATPSFTNAEPVTAAADPFNNLYVNSYLETVNLRKFAYSGTPAAPVYAAAATYSAISMTTNGAPYQLVFDANLDLLEYLDPVYGGSTTSPYACQLDNQSTTAYTYMSAAPSPAYTNCTTGGGNAVQLPGNTGSSIIASGIAATSTGALTIGSNGFTKITRSAGTQPYNSTIAITSTTPIPAVNSVLYSRYVSADGRDWGYSSDGANGQVSGVSAFDSTDAVALGTYKGCFVYATTNVCGTDNLVGGATSAASTQVPMASPRSAGIDSSGDIWVVSGNVGDLTELIGVAAPTWPGLSMAKFGLPQ